jgi:hypothetical protein
MMLRAHCKRTDDPHSEWELFLPGKSNEAPGFLTLVERGVRIGPVELPSRVNRIVLAAYFARQSDDALGLRGSSRGWRTAIQLNDILNRELGHYYRLEPATVSKYVAMLIKLLSNFRTAIGGCAPPLLQRRRYLGYRLAENVHLIIRRSSKAPASAEALKKHITPPVQLLIRDADLMDVKHKKEGTAMIAQTKTNPQKPHRCR